MKHSQNSKEIKKVSQHAHACRVLKILIQGRNERKKDIELRRSCIDIEYCEGKFY